MTNNPSIMAEISYWENKKEEFVNFLVNAMQLNLHDEDWEFGDKEIGSYLDAYTSKAKDPITFTTGWLKGLMLINTLYKQVFTNTKEATEKLILDKQAQELVVTNMFFIVATINYLIGLYKNVDRDQISE